MAAQRQPMQFAPESQLQTLSRIAPGINALRGVQQQQMEQERLSSEDAAFEQLRRGAQEVLGNPNATISDLARVVINNAKTPAQFDAGQKLLQAELGYRQRKERLARFSGQPMTANALAAGRAARGSAYSNAIGGALGSYQNYLNRQQEERLIRDIFGRTTVGG